MHRCTHTCKPHVRTRMGKGTGAWTKVALISMASSGTPRSAMVTRPELVGRLTPCFPYLEFYSDSHSSGKPQKLNLKSVPPQHQSKNERETKVTVVCTSSCAFSSVVTTERSTQHLSLTSQKLEHTQSSHSGTSQTKSNLERNLCPRAGAGFSFSRTSQVSTLHWLPR